MGRAGVLLATVAALGNGEQAAPPQLTTVEGFDDAGGAVLFLSTSETDEAVRKCLVHPAADKFTLNLACEPGSIMTVDGVKKKFGEVAFKRDKSRATQVIDVACYNPKAKDPNPNQQKYAFLVESDYLEDEIPLPGLKVVTTGAECTFEQEEDGNGKGRFKCPKPEMTNEDTNSTSVTPIIRMESTNDPTVKYFLRDGTRLIDIRLLNGKPTVPFRYKNSMTLVAQSGRTTKEWPVSFGGSALGSLLKAIGAVLAIVLFILLAALVLVVGSSGLFGLGVPLGSTEIAAAFTLVMQYLCFSNFLRGSNKLESLIGPMKWVTFFGPAPVTLFDDRADSGSAQPQFGDITDIRSAWGGAFWSMVIMGLLLVVHGFILAIFKSQEQRFTVPHRVRFGNWEQRWLNWLCFPLTAAATVMILGEGATPISMAVGALLLVIMTINVGIVFVQLASSVSNNEVCWIWNMSVRESGRPSGSLDQYAGDGYWTDVCADQLVTQPVSRSIVPFFPYQWVNTVADIKPVSISHSLISESNKEVYPPQKMKKAHQAPSYPLGKAPQVVSVIKTRKPSCCAGQRLISGLLRTRWLDILFTYQGLVKFFTDEHGNVEVPLVVKTSQLAGPITSGSNAFYYDGARIPFIRVAETIYKIFLGVMVACCGVASFESVHAILFAVICVVSLAMGIYVIGTKPYARTLENWLMLGTFGAIGICAAGFCFYKFKGDTTGTDCFLHFVAFCAFCLAVYACIVIFCVFTAVLCPPLHEARFLETLGNCTVVVMDPSNQEEVNMTGYSKYSVRDLMALSRSKGGAATQGSQTQGGSTLGSHYSADEKRIQVQRYGYGQEELILKFYHAELRKACKTGDIPVPY